MGFSKEHMDEFGEHVSKYAKILSDAKAKNEDMKHHIDEMLQETELLRQKYIDEQWQEDDERLAKKRADAIAAGKKFKGYDLDTFEPIYE
jgi:hypothetical protein